jgi:hypothetical protein
MSSCKTKAVWVAASGGVIYICATGRGRGLTRSG